MKKLIGALMIVVGFQCATQSQATEATPQVNQQSATVRAYDAVQYNKTIRLNAKILPGMRHGMYEKIYGTTGNNPAISNSSQWANAPVELVREAKTVRAVWYQAKTTSGALFWMDAKGFQVYDAVQSEKQIFHLGAVTNQSYNVYKYIYGTISEGLNKPIANTTSLKTATLQITKEAKTAKGTWYYITNGAGVSGWVDKRAILLFDKIEGEKAVTFNARVLPKNNHGIFGKIYYTSPNNPKLASSSKYDNQDVQIIREAKTVKAKWYQFAINGQTIGWMDAKGFALYDIVSNEKAVNISTKVLAGNNHGIYGKIYGTIGNNPRLAGSSKYNNQNVQVIREATTAKAKWYQFAINGKTIGWMDAKGFASYDSIQDEKQVNMNAKVLAGNNHGIYGHIYGTTGNNPRLAGSSKYNNQDVQILKEAKTVRATWYQFAVNGQTIGWMDAKGFKPYDAMIGFPTPMRRDMVLNVSDGKNHGIYKEVYGTIGNNPRIAGAHAYKGQTVRVICLAKTAKATWYQFEINGQVIGWIDSNAFA